MLLKEKRLDSIKDILPNLDFNTEEQLGDLSPMADDLDRDIFNIMPYICQETLQAEAQFHRIAMAMTRSLITYPTGEDLSEVYWRSRIFDYDRSQSSNFVNQFEGYLSWLEDTIYSGQRAQRAQEDSLAVTRMPRWPCAILMTVTALWKLYSRGSNSIIPTGYFSLGFWVSIWSIIYSYLKMKVEICERVQDIGLQFVKLNEWQNKHSDVVEQMRTKAQGRSFCVTENGYIGWVSGYAQPGDKIFALEGGQFPYVVRRSTNTTQQDYKLCGDCYVHGLVGRDLYQESSVQAVEVYLV